VPLRVQLVAGLNAPVPLVVKLTEPEGVTTVPSEVSVTDAAQKVALFTLTKDGTQLTLVVVFLRSRAIMSFGDKALL
jgi:hypothetical protein